MILEPALDLVDQEELRSRVPQQVEQFDRWFSPLNDIIEALVRLLKAFKGRIVIYVCDSLTIKLIVEPLQSISELGPRWHIFWTTARFELILFSVLGAIFG